MRLIIPGQFKMGSPIKEKERYDDETLHDVMLTKPYWLADTTCTQDLWQAVMGKNPSYFKGGLLPVEEISWQDCVEFIGKVNKKVPGLQLRLPTEAEWEYACRANEEKPFWFGDSITPEQVNYDGSEPYAGGEKGLYRQKTVKVKELPCNGWGLFQMHGNVWEWCADWKNDYPETLVINPMGPSVGEERVLRGGSWFNFGRFVRSAFRNCSKPATRFNNIGVRLAGG
ncbi:MAG: formylglycine-generating enzyme family protein [bacterium]|nr:formylglycine-generating enzyme family protein [bacterium]